MGDRVAVMRKGELQQVAPPQELYDRPVNLFVGGFIGSPAMNLLEATLERRERRLCRATSASQRSRSTSELARRAPALARATTGREVILGIRPEDLEDAALAPTRRPTGACAARSTLREALGSEIMVHFDDRRAARR